MAASPTLTRQPAVAGTFYPGVRNQLASAVDGYLRDAESSRAAQGPAPKAVVAPHAGYLYSGAVAASAYTTLRDSRDLVRRVVLLGPSHRIALRGLAASSASAFRTPLGEVPLDREAIERARRALPFLRDLRYDLFGYSAGAVGSRVESPASSQRPTRQT